MAFRLAFSGWLLQFLVPVFDEPASRIVGSQAFPEFPNLFFLRFLFCPLYFFPRLLFLSDFRFLLCVLFDAVCDGCVGAVFFRFEALHFFETLRNQPPQVSLPFAVIFSL